jgi:hypothetical protein
LRDYLLKFIMSKSFNIQIDMEGKYGMSENSMAIQVDNIDEAINIKKTLLSNNFKQLIKSCIIGNFRIDWRLFKEFKKRFLEGVYLNFNVCLIYYNIFFK